MVDDDRLRVVAVVRSRRAVTDVSDRDVALSETVDYFGGENIVDKPRVLI